MKPRKEIKEDNEVKGGNERRKQRRKMKETNEGRKDGRMD